jgi:hypothetical protein
VPQNRARNSDILEEAKFGFQKSFFLLNKPEVTPLALCASKSMSLSRGHQGLFCAWAGPAAFLVEREIFKKPDESVDTEVR